MNNFNLMRAGGVAIEFLGGEGQLFASVAWRKSQALPIFWSLIEERCGGPRTAISPELFTRLPEASRKAVGIVVAKWDEIYELDDWPCAPVGEMLAELEQTPEGSPLDRALDSIARATAKFSPTIAAELAAREAREIAAATQQPEPAAVRKSGRL